ncbi:MAG: class I SAM-dependent methyltransferase [Alphaproteobacteria bacterium]|nr:class I SAM-dependent methyltransferase [Alphaproteobacteria bacterium]
MSEFLRFYGSHQIIPVHQDITDFGDHLARRRWLYRTLGVNRLAFRGASVLEIGPGTGDNGLVYPYLGVSKVTFIEGNAASVATVRDKNAQGLYGDVPVEIVESDFNAVDGLSGAFDIVICEGVIPGQDDPARSVRKVLDFATPGGVVVMTATCYTSMLAEILRRAMRFWQCGTGDPFEEQTAKLARFFAPDLAGLPGMKRLPADWVLDNIQFPFPRNMVFPLQNHLKAVGEDAVVLGTSPSMTVDWRWYKQIDRASEARNDRAAAALALLQPHLIDYRIDAFSPRIGAVTDEIEALAEDVFHAHFDAWSVDGNRDQGIRKVCDLAGRINALIEMEFPQTSKAIKAYRRCFSNPSNPDFRALDDGFREWFGRGQQYIALEKV